MKIRIELIEEPAEEEIVIRYITSTNLQTVNIEASFGSAEVYFDHAQIPSGNVTVNVDINFSGIQLYVPHNWQVINHVEIGRAHV